MQIGTKGIENLLVIGVLGKNFEKRHSKKTFPFLFI
jgi:hypothetical protein